MIRTRFLLFVADLRLCFWFAIAAVLILLLDNPDRKEYADRLRYYCDQANSPDPFDADARRLAEQRRLVGEEMPDVLEAWDELRAEQEQMAERLRPFAEYLERLP